MYKGRLDSDDCFKVPGSSCGWCGTAYNKGVCLPGNFSGPGYRSNITMKCDYWDFKFNCMYRGKSDSDDCFKVNGYNCGWCGTTYNKGICLPSNWSRPSNTCKYWESGSNCMYSGRAGPVSCAGAGICKWCNTTGICLPRNSPDCNSLKLEKDPCSVYSNNEDLCVKNSCGWCVKDKYNQGCISLLDSDKKNCLLLRKN